MIDIDPPVLVETPMPLLTKEQLNSLIDSLAKDTRIVFHCHSGQRSEAAANHYIGKGYTNVYNLVGGIAAWSAEIDSGVPRY